MGQQLSQHASEVLRIIRAIEAQQVELEVLILKTPTGQVREDLTAGNIHMAAAVGELKNVI